MDARRIVIKLGTNTLCDPDGLPDRALMAALAEELRDLRQQGRQFLVVTSGAIGTGRAALKLADRRLDVPMRQACAAVGQHRLMQAWDEALSRHRMRAAQVLVTADTFRDRRRYVNMRNCLEALLKVGAVPVINENDTTATDEIDETFGDNDALGAMVAAKVEADLYVMLSDVQGLYDRPPHAEGAVLVRHVERIDAQVVAMAGERPGRRVRGGMVSKLQSAQYLAEAGVPSVIAYGRGDRVLHRLLDDDPPGTWFEPVGRRDGMERWIAATRPAGAIEVDEGAVRALRDGFHLLPAGVTAVTGDFPVESVVEIRHSGRVVGRAVSLLSSRDIERCKGQQSEAAKSVLGIDGTVNVTRKGRLVLHE